MNKLLFACLFCMFIFSSQLSNACTNFIVTKGASADGSTMISYSADSHDLYGYLYYLKGQTWPDNAMLKVYDWDSNKYLGEIKQAKQTYTVVGNMNEFQVSIAETTFEGREELVDTTGIVDYGSLMYIALQRSKTAREAIKVMTDLVSKYGYYSSGESFSIADKNEAWIMDMIGDGAGKKGAVWVARKIPDGMVSGHANQSRITTFPLNDKENCLYSDDVISLAKEKGYYKGKDKNFSFADAYNPINFEGIRFCEARVWSAFRQMNPNMQKYESYIKGESNKRLPLWIKPTKKVSYRDVQHLMRDHFEGTFMDMTKDVGAGPFKLPYRFRPLTWKVNGQEYLNERATATQQTGFTFVAQMRNWLPNKIGGVLWFGVDDAATTVYVPIYCGINEVPYAYKKGNGDMIDFSWKSAFWVFNWVANKAYSRYDVMIKDINKAQLKLEDKFENYAPAIEQAAMTLNKRDPQLANQFLTEYSINQSSITLNKWKDLGKFLMVKYLDGNLHSEKNGVFLRNKYGSPVHAKFPGYSKEFYENIAKTTGDHLKVKTKQK